MTNGGIKYIMKYNYKNYSCRLIVLSQIIGMRLATEGLTIGRYQTYDMLGDLGT